MSRSSSGDKFELVDVDFDDVGDDRVDGVDDDIDEEHSPVMLEHFSLISLAVNTSSSSISESELGAVDDGAGANLPAARKFCSNSSNCPIKFKFGDIIGRANLTIL